ncbi:MAG: hypothetical protein PVG65_01045 [Candidatus Thorarchaeota archaeon]|jgi:hypothetical protein
MSREIQHASACKPISVPVNNDVAPDNWDRLQTFSASTNQPQEKVYEIGRLVKMDFDKDILEATLSMVQLEYGTNDSFLQLAGLSAEPSGGFELNDFDDPRTDFYSPGKDEYGGTVEQTLWLQYMALDSLGIEISAEERIIRNFELSGDYCKIARNANKYLIFKEDDAPSGTSGNYVIDVSDPAPVVDPNNAGVYILALWRIRSGVATQLTLTTDYTYNNGTNQITILSALTGDNYRIWYTAGSYGSAGDPTSLNDSDDYYLGAENVTITIDDGTHSPVELDKLTDFSITATLNRTEEGKIGSASKFRDVENYDVSVSLSGFVKDSTIQEALMQQAGQSWGIIDYSLFDAVDVIVKIYQESTKSTFLIGYKASDVEFADDGNDKNANENTDESVTLNGDALLITTTEGDL